MNTVTDHGLLPAWDDNVHDAQSTFRSILQALAEPGLLQTLPVAVTGPAPLSSAMTALCLTLADFETPVWLDNAARVRAVESYLRFHCSCPLTAQPSLAHFAVLTQPASGSALEGFAEGTMEYPDRSATLFIEVPSLTDGPTMTLSGPGIDGTQTLRVGGLPDDFRLFWAANGARFPLGVDIIFCCGDAIAGLPRTTQIAP